MVSFGERLKRTRENKKMTLDDVARATKITTRMLSALEQEKFDQLPGGVFNKGFVRAYARHLGLDEEQALRDYAQAATPQETTAQVEGAELRAIAERKDKERANRPASRGLPWGIVAALLLLVAIALSTWGFLSRERNASSQIRSPISEPVAARSSSIARPNSPVNPPFPTEVASTQTVSERVAENSALVSEGPSASATAINLAVSAHQDSWLTITVDGEPFYQGRLAAGARQIISAQNEVVLKSGNVGGLDITFNGTKLPAQGGDAEVKTLVFGPSGLIDNPGVKPSN